MNLWMSVSILGHQYATFNRWYKLCMPGCHLAGVVCVHVMDELFVQLSCHKGVGLQEEYVLLVRV